MRFQNLDLDTLRTPVVVANDLGGYSQAAKRLGRSPSAISLQMKRLQEGVGVPLFRRSGRSLALTEAGDMTLRMGRRMLALNDDLIEACAAPRSLVTCALVSRRTLLTRCCSRPSAKTRRRHAPGPGRRLIPVGVQATIALLLSEICIQFSDSE
jgi:DNA-binding transcriptional LysR family regulator